MSEGLRLMLYDATCRGKLTGLSHIWQAGAGVYRTLDRLDASFGASNWTEALAWAARHEPHLPILEIQFWGHGKWGGAKIDGELLSEKSLDDGHPHRGALDAVRERMRADSLWWFRTCETFGAAAGHRFAQRWTDHFGCHAAGHTYIIAYWQSGLHLLGPGQAPRWSQTEGLKRGTPDAPKQAKWSRPWSPNTISCLRGTIPTGF
jgi:hypothetical protein